MNLDLLDLLLEKDDQNINNNSMFTDTWGEWWGLLFQMVLNRSVEGVSLLLKNGAEPPIKNWGDCIEMAPVELAHDLLDKAENQKDINILKDIIELLQNPDSARYIRKTNPPIPELTDKERAIDRAADVQANTGLRFQDENFT